MTRSEAASEVKRRYAEYLQPAKKRGYICPLCDNGTGSDGDGMSIDPKGDGTQLKCFKCGFYGDIVDLYQKQHDCSTGEAFKALYDRFNIVIDENRPATMPAARRYDTDSTTHTEKPAEREKTALDEKPDFSEYIASCHAHINDAAAQEYLAYRGLSADTAARFFLGYDPARKLLVIPVSRSFYIARNTDKAAELRYYNPKGASIELFNCMALDGNRPCFVVEGAIDALSIIEAGGNAISLNSASNTRLLLDRIDAQRPKTVLILALDADQAGNQAVERLIDGLKTRNVPFTIADVNGGRKDPFDKRVYIAVAALFNAGKAVISYAEIYCNMGYKGRPGAVDIEKKDRAISKMSAAHIYVDNKSEIDARYNYPSFRYDGSLLPLERVRAVVNGQITDGAINLFREPPLVAFARGRKQFTTITRQVLESPLSKTNQNLTLEDYLIDEIARLKKRERRSTFILDTVYRDAKITTAKQRQRAPDKIRKLLEHYVSCGLIADYEMKTDRFIIQLAPKKPR